jgi:hypothetical protein
LHTNAKPLINLQDKRIQSKKCPILLCFNWTWNKNCFQPSINKIHYFLIHQSMNQDHKRVEDFGFLFLDWIKFRIMNKWIASWIWNGTSKNVMSSRWLLNKFWIRTKAMMVWIIIGILNGGKTLSNKGKLNEMNFWSLKKKMRLNRYWNVLVKFFFQINF